MMHLRSTTIFAATAFVILCCQIETGVRANAECVYQYDMKNNRVKITCGQGAVLHIVDQHGNTLLTGETSSVAETPVVFQLNRYKFNFCLNLLLK